MYSNPADSTSVCDRCGKQLQYGPCYVCDGRGYYRTLVIFKTECEVCSGSGRVLRCPDEHQHVIEDLSLSPTFSTRSLYKGFQKSASTKTPVRKPSLTATVKPSAPQVPPPWHPSYPNPWHPMHPNNPRNQPFNPLNPNSPTNPHNLRNPMHPLNPNNPMNRKPPNR
jgi:hypothetical protein